MLILYNNKFKRKNLIKIIKINGLKNYSKLKKSELIELINMNKATVFIQKIFRQKYNDDLICPITLCRLKYPFISIKNNNNFRYYSLIEFIEYLNKSINDFKDPFTRESLTNDSLKHIEYLINYYKIKKNF